MSSELSSAAGVARRVALYTESPEPSGVGAHMLTLARAYGRSEAVSFAFMTGPRTRGCREAAAALGAPVTALPAVGPQHHPRAAHVRAFLRRRRPDVLHVHAGITWEALSVAAIAREEGVPTIVRTEHLPYLLPHRAPEIARAGYAAMLGDLDALVCVSQSVADTYAAAGAPERLIRVALNGIEPPPRTDRVEARGRLGLGARRPVLLTVARFTDQKGYWALLDTVPHVLKAVPDALFLLVGEGPIKRWIEAAVARRGLQTAVKFLGSRRDIPDLTAAADALLVPSWFEGHPLVVLEAMFAGLPIAAFDSPGVNEAVTGDRTGLLAMRGDVEALASAAVTLLTQGAMSERLARAAQSDAAARFTAAHMAGRTRAVYDACTPESARVREAA